MRIVDLIRRLSKNRPLAALVGAGAVSSIGDWIYLTAMPVLVYQRTGDPALVGLAALGRLVPFLVLSMPAGIVADRLPRRAILVATETVRCIAMLLIAWLCAMGGDVAPMIVLTVAAAAAGTFSFPALGSLTPELATDDAELGQANAIYATLDSLACVVGPALAGALIVTGGLPIAFALNGLSFATVAVALLVWRSPAGGPATPDRGSAPPTGLGHGPTWRALIRRIAGPLALDGAISFASAAMSVMTVIVAVDWLGAGASFTGILNTAGGLGGIFGGIAAGLAMNGRSRAAIAVAVVSFAGATILLGSAAIPALAVGATTISFGALIMLDTLNMTAIQRLTSGGGTGRALGLLHTLAAVWMMAGVVVPTLCLTTLGVQAAILVPAGVVLALGGASALASGGARPTSGVHAGFEASAA